MAECKQKERKIGHSFFLFQKHPSKIILTTNPQRRDKAYKKKTDNQPQTVQSAVQRGYTHTSNNKGHNCATSSPKKKKKKTEGEKKQPINHHHQAFIFFLLVFFATTWGCCC